MDATMVDGATRISDAFARAGDEGRSALVIYLPAGYPDLETSEECLVAAVEAGADVVEIGFPFSDPMMDGPTIQAANQVALDAGYGVTDDLVLASRLTERIDAPALVMTYYTIPDARGLEWFAEQALAAGIAGAILPDLPASEAGDWLAQARPRGLGTVFLASSVSSDDRLQAIAEASTGFVYATGLLGVTGVKSVAQDATEGLVRRLRPLTDAPIAVGVGVRTPADAARVATYADGVIVGSAVVQAVADGDAAGAPDRVRALVAALRDGVARHP